MGIMINQEDVRDVFLKWNKDWLNSDKTSDIDGTVDCANEQAKCFMDYLDEVHKEKYYDK